MDEFLAAVERQTGLTPGEIGRPSKATARYAGFVRAEMLPALVVWPEGESDLELEPDGSVFGTVGIAVVYVVESQDEESTAELAALYGRAVRGLLLNRPIAVDGERHALVPTDGDLTASTAREDGGIRAASILRYDVENVYLGSRHGGPPPDAVPRPVVSPPWPPTGPVEHADVQLDETPSP